MTSRLSYLAAYAQGRRWVEVLVVREGGRQISQEPTGVTYPSARAMQAGLAAKNRK